MTAPSVAGTYYYGACVDDVTNESKTDNNCSEAVSVTVTVGAPDLVMEGISVDESTLDAGESFTLSAVVRNRGYGTSAATTLRYYRSDDTAISTADAEVGTDNLGALATGNDSALSIDLDAPTEPGTVYYGACVDAVSGESDADNNCSGAVAVTVRAPRAIRTAGPAGWWRQAAVAASAIRTTHSMSTRTDRAASGPGSRCVGRAGSSCDRQR